MAVATTRRQRTASAAAAGVGLAVRLGRRLSAKDGQQVADVLSAGKRVGEGQVGLDRVVVTAAVARAGYVAGGGEFDDDSVGGAFSDPDRPADLAQADPGVVSDAEEDLRVVGEKGPARSSVLRHPH